MFKRALPVLGTVALAAGCLAPTAGAAGGPPLPKAANGAAVQVVAAGLQTPTSFAFGARQLFEGDGGNPPQSRGGVYQLKAGKATLLPGSPAFVGGLVWNRGTLYVSAANFGAKGAPVPEILAWSGWNGTKFTKQAVFYKPPKNFPGFNGLAIGHDGRLYVGVDVSLTGSNDHGPARAPYQYDILAFSLKGKVHKPQIFARGLRQPWQLAFPAGSNSPLVTDLGQDAPKGINPPDLLVRVKQGENYGFPKCNWLAPKKCKGFAKPLQLFAPHTDIGGVGIVGKTAYLTEFGMGGLPPQVVSVPVAGGKVKTVLSGFVAPVVGLAVHGHWLYVGSVAGFVYRVKV